MGLPGHRRTSSHKRRRASHFALKKMNLAVCPKCQEPVQPHRVCPTCGTYAGRQVIKLKNPLDKKPAGKKEAASSGKSAAASKKEEKAG